MYTLSHLFEILNRFLAKDREDTKFLKEAKKKEIRNNLCCRELICDAEGLVNAYIKRDEDVFKRIVSKYYKGDDEQAKEEMGNVIMFILEYVKKLLSN